MHITTGFNKIDCTSTNNNSNLQNRTHTCTSLTSSVGAKHQNHFTNTKDFETTTKMKSNTPKHHWAQLHHTIPRLTIATMVTPVKDPSKVFIRNTKTLKAKVRIFIHVCKLVQIKIVPLFSIPLLLEAPGTSSKSRVFLIPPLLPCTFSNLSTRNITYVKNGPHSFPPPKHILPSSVLVHFH